MDDAVSDTAKLGNQILRNCFPVMSSSSAFAAIEEDPAYAQLFRKEMQRLYTKLHRLYLSVVQVQKKKKAALKTNSDAHAASTTQEPNHSSTANVAVNDVAVEAQEEEDKDQDEDQEEEPTDEVLRSHIKRLIPLVNLQYTGVKAFTKLLSKECGGANLKPRSKFIEQALSDAINAMDESESEDESEDQEEEPTDEVLRSHIKRLIPLVNLQYTNFKAFKKLLSKECGGANLKPRSKFIKQALSDAINAMDESELEDEKPEKKKRATGLLMKKEISSELASFMGISSPVVALSEDQDIVAPIVLNEDASGFCDSDSDDEIPTSPHNTRFAMKKRKLAEERNAVCPDGLAVDINPPVVALAEDQDIVAPIVLNEDAGGYCDSDSDDEISTSPHNTRFAMKKRKLAEERNAVCPDAKRKKAQELVESLLQGSKEAVKRQDRMDKIDERNSLLGVVNIQESTNDPKLFTRRNPENVQRSLLNYVNEEQPERLCNLTTYAESLASIKSQPRDELIEGNRQRMIALIKKWGDGRTNPYRKSERDSICDVLYNIKRYQISPSKELEIPDLFKYFTERINRSRSGAEISPDQLDDLMDKYGPFSEIAKTPRRSPRGQRKSSPKVVT